MNRSGTIRFINTLSLQTFNCCRLMNPVLVTECNPNIWFMCYYLNMVNRANQGWGQFNSGIGIAAQFQFQFRNWNWNWNWNWWNWKWNWNWNPWNWNWNPELNFLQLLPQHLLVSQPFPNFTFNRGGYNLSCDWLLMQQVCLLSSWDIAPCGLVTKDYGEGTLFPLIGQRPEGLKMVTVHISSPHWHKQNYYHCWINE